MGAPLLYILVSVDTVELGPDKTRHVFCGAAEGTPYVAFDGPSLLLGAEGESETIACRTVLRGREHRALESQVTLGGSRLEAQLVLDGRVLGAREVTLKAQEKPSERYAFTDLGFVSDGDRGLVTARYDGGVVEALVRGSEPSVVRPSPLGREAWTFATSATPEGFVTWATTAQNPGSFGHLRAHPEPRDRRPTRPRSRGSRASRARATSGRSCRRARRARARGSRSSSAQTAEGEACS
ncbi:MAG: hypothetical protein IPK71_08235 [Myxococcales bacterium]|nr:hypothetical protein [Myxococcales bacterium]